MGTTTIPMTFCLVQIEIGYKVKNKSYGEINIPHDEIDIPFKEIDIGFNVKDKCYGEIGIPFNEIGISFSFSTHPIALSDAMQLLG